MGNRHLKALLEAIFADEAVALAYRTAPAAKSIHHGWIGGLVEHVLSVCQLAKVTAAHYPDVDFDLLLTGVILHDIGKMALPDSVLLKPGPLDIRETEHMHLHP